jgi:hypothetical protein
MEAQSDNKVWLIHRGVDPSFVFPKTTISPDKAKQVPECEKSRNQNLLSVFEREKTSYDLASCLHMAISLHRIPEYLYDRRDHIVDATRSQGIDPAKDVMYLTTCGGYDRPLDSLDYLIFL